jgi:hypothetical protein
MDERRKSERASCRLTCRVLHGQQTTRARIADVSEGGLCLLSPGWLKPREEVQISIDVPGSGASTVRAEIWHVRREKSQATGNRVSVIGAIVVEADDRYQKLVKAAGVAVGTEVESTPPVEADSIDCLDEIPAKSYRIRSKATGGPRSRVLTLAASSEDEARSIAVRDLGDAWDVLEIREA